MLQAKKGYSVPDGRSFLDIRGNKLRQDVAWSPIENGQGEVSCLAVRHCGSPCGWEQRQRLRLQFCVVSPTKRWFLPICHWLPLTEHLREVPLGAHHGAISETPDWTPPCDPLTARRGKCISMYRYIATARGARARRPSLVIVPGVGCPALCRATKHLGKKMARRETKLHEAGVVGRINPSKNPTPLTP